MITSPNDIPNCLLWLDGNDTSTMFREVSVNVQGRRFNYIFLSDNISVWDMSYTNDPTYLSLPGNTGNSSGSSTFTTLRPDGVRNASYVYDHPNQHTANVARYYYQYIYTPYTGTYTVSFYIKAVNYPFVYLSLDGATAVFNTTTKVFTTQTGGTWSKVDAQDATEFNGSANAAGWYRIALTKTMTGSSAAKTLTIAPNLLQTQTNGARLGIASSVMFLGMFMLERSATLNPYIDNAAFERVFDDGTNVAYATLPITPLSAIGQEVAYWKNKSLSASALGLSGLFCHEENSWRKPVTYSWAPGLTALKFDRDYLSSQTLTVPITTTDQTVFVVCGRNSNSTSQYNPDWSTHYVVFAQHLSGSNNANQFEPLVYAGGGGVANTNTNTGRRSHCTRVSQSSSFNAMSRRLSWLENPPLDSQRITYDYDSLGALYRMKKTGSYFDNALDKSPVQGGTAHTTFYDGNNISDYRLGYNGRLSRATNFPQLSTTTADIFRIGVIYAGSNDIGPRTTQNIAEIIMFDRSLTDSEIYDVEDYLYKKWLEPYRPRRVYALSDGNMSSNSIFSIASEPSPRNVLLSADIVFTNGYTLTADTDLRVGVITNAPALSGVGGGYVVMTQGVSLSANIIGSRSPYTVLVPSNTSCNICGNIFGGEYDEGFVYNNPLSAQNSVGVYVDRGGVLFLSGSAYGGVNRYSTGISTDGGNVFLTNKLVGSGVYSQFNNGANGTYYDGSIYGFGLSAINTNVTLTNNTVNNGGLTCGLYTDKCNVVLQDCNIESIWDKVNRNNGGVYNIGLYPSDGTSLYQGVALVTNSSALSAFNTRFIGLTGVTSSITSTTYVIYNTTGTHSGTAFWQLSGTSYLSNCFIIGPSRTKVPNIYEYLTPALGFNQGVRLTNKALLTGVNCTILGSPGIFGRDEYQNRAGLYIELSSTAVLQNSVVNTSQGKYNIGIINNGNLTISGEIKGGYRADGGASPYRFYGIYNRGFLSIKGTVSPNYNGSAAIFGSSEGSMAITGTFKAGGPLASTILSHGELTAFYSEPLISSIRGRVPIDARQCVFVSLCSTSLYSLFSVDGVETTMVYLGSGAVLNQPLPSDVLLGVTYSPFDALTGTSIIPPLSDTIIGVPVRDSYGTRKPMTVDALWNQTSTTIVEVSSQVYSKLINPFTSAALSALVNSMDYPWSIKT